MTRIANAEAELGEIEVTDAMIAADEDAILRQVGGADLGGYFSARDLAVEVYRAMASLRRSGPIRPDRQSG
jgi:hypothetical protein